MPERSAQVVRDAREVTLAALGAALWEVCGVKASRAQCCAIAERVPFVVPATEEASWGRPAAGVRGTSGPLGAGITDDPPAVAQAELLHAHDWARAIMRNPDYCPAAPLRVLAAQFLVLFRRREDELRLRALRELSLEASELLYRASLLSDRAPGMRDEVAHG